MKRRSYRLNEDEETPLKLELCSIPLDNWRIFGSLTRGNTRSGVGEARTLYKQLEVSVQRKDNSSPFSLREIYYTYEVTLKKKGFMAVSSNRSSIREYCHQARQPIAQTVYNHLGNKIEESLRLLGQEETERLSKKFRGFMGYQNETTK